MTFKNALNSLICFEGREFAEKHKYNLRSMLALKAQREYSGGDRDTNGTRDVIWCIAFCLPGVNSSPLVNEKKPRKERIAYLKSEMKRVGITQWEPNRKR